MDTANFSFLRLLAGSAVLAGVVALLGLSSLGKGHNPPPARLATGAAQPVVVELFTSEGCSSCPPADALLKELSEKPSLEGIEVVALEEHVDYWNHLGWADPYSAGAFSQRQSEYAEHFGRDGVYTPQMIVDGRTEFVGSRGLIAREEIRKAASVRKLDIGLARVAESTPDHPAIQIAIQNPGSVPVKGGAELWVAITERNLQSDVKGGENSGEILKHAAVVRSLQKVRMLPEPAGYTGQIDLFVRPNWKKDDLSAVVFLSEPGSRKIIGAATTPLHP
jgi:hypothetical protein